MSALTFKNGSIVDGRPNPFFVILDDDKKCLAMGKQNKEWHNVKTRYIKEDLQNQKRCWLSKRTVVDGRNPPITNAEDLHDLYFGNGGEIDAADANPFPIEQVQQLSNEELQQLKDEVEKGKQAIEVEKQETTACTYQYEKDFKPYLCYSCKQVYPISTTQQYASDTEEYKKHRGEEKYKDQKECTDKPSTNIYAACLCTQSFQFKENYELHLALAKEQSKQTNSDKVTTGGSTSVDGTKVASSSESSSPDEPKPAATATPQSEPTRVVPPQSSAVNPPFMDNKSQPIVTSATAKCTFQIPEGMRTQVCVLEEQKNKGQCREIFLVPQEIGVDHPKMKETSGYINHIKKCTGKPETEVHKICLCGQVFYTQTEYQAHLG